MLSFSKVYKTYTPELGEKRKPALKNLSFSLKKGETLGLAGANGAGKSTCIRLIMDLIRPDSGEILINGNSLKKPLYRRDIGYLAEVPALPLNLNLMDLLLFQARVQGLSRAFFKENSEKLIKSFMLWEARKRPFRSYSKGMQQRASFIMALLHNPDFLILDEPTSGLDPIGRSHISSIIKDLKEEGKTIIFCTHILEDVERMADRILILHKGEKRFEGSMEELYSRYKTDSINKAFLLSIDMPEGSAAHGDKEDL